MDSVDSARGWRVCFNGGRTVVTRKLLIYTWNRGLPVQSSIAVCQLRPDAVNYAENIVRELKPDTPAGMAKGWRQVNGYKEYLEGLTSDTWTAVADVYKR